MALGLPLAGCQGGSASGDDGGSGDEAWSAPVVISEGGPTAFFPSVGVDAEGNAFAVFVEGEPELRLQFNRFTKGAGWGENVGVREASDVGIYRRPSLSVLPEGRAFFAIVEANRRGEADTLTTDRVEATDDITGGAPFLSEVVMDPKVAFNAASNGLTVVAEGPATGPTRAFAKRFVSGVENRTIRLDAGTLSVGVALAVDVNDANQAVVAYSKGVGSGLSLFAATSKDFRVGDDGGFDNLLVDDLSPPALNPDADLNESGIAFVVWQQEAIESATASGIYAVMRDLEDDSGGWSSPARVDIDTGVRAQRASEPEVEVGANGDALAVWQEVRATGSQIWANRYLAGAGWQEARRIDETKGTAVEPRLAMLPDGRAIAVWRETDGDESGIHSARFDPDGGWDDPLEIEDDAPGTTARPDVALAANGSAIAVWGVIATDEPEDSGIKASRLR